LTELPRCAQAWRKAPEACKKGRAARLALWRPRSSGHRVCSAACRKAWWGLTVFHAAPAACSWESQARALSLVALAACSQGMKAALATLAFPAERAAYSWAWRGWQECPAIHVSPAGCNWGMAAYN
jgi:hypothetical protein